MGRKKWVMLGSKRNIGSDTTVYCLFHHINNIYINTHMKSPKNKFEQ
jgi:hypothetical protein